MHVIATKSSRLKEKLIAIYTIYVLLALATPRVRHTGH